MLYHIGTATDGERLHRLLLDTDTNNLKTQYERGYSVSEIGDCEITEIFAEPYDPAE